MFIALVNYYAIRIWQLYSDRNIGQKLYDPIKR